jgi:hypothetical protein
MDTSGRRRSDRILLPLPIRVTGIDALGQPFDEEAVTVNCNQHGACISLTRSLTPEQRLRIRNLQNGLEDGFRVVGALRPVFGERREWGVEALNPERNIWGVLFTPPAEGIQPKALLCCAACEYAVLTPVSSMAYDVLLFTGNISRHCDRCGETTRWQPCQHQTTGELAAPPSQPVPVQQERRNHRRLKLAMLLRVGDSRGETETVQTEDVSKGGVCFASKRERSVGSEIRCTLPFADKAPPAETKGRIVWGRRTSGGFLYGVSFVKEKTR